jgi:hypothetical protein
MTCTIVTHVSLTVLESNFTSVYKIMGSLIRVNIEGRKCKWPMKKIPASTGRGVCMTPPEATGPKDIERKILHAKFHAQKRNNNARDWSQLLISCEFSETVPSSQESI